MTTDTKVADLPPLPATYAAGTFAPDVPVYDAGQMRAYAASALARQEQESALQVIEQIAQQWDGCVYDAVGETIDIGDAIRRAGKRLEEAATPAAQADDWYARAVAAEKLSVPHGYKLVRDSETQAAPPTQVVDLEPFRKLAEAMDKNSAVPGCNNAGWRYACATYGGELRRLIDQQAGKENING